MRRYTSVLCLALSSLLTPTLQKGLPQVDLGYEVHEIFSYNETTDLYKFRNIRYAQPPVGELRFAAPVPPIGRSSQVENGSVTRMCPQAAPTWAYISQLFQANVTAGNALSFNYSAAEEEVQVYLASLPESGPDPTETEDCLFLDVVVPKVVFDNAQNRSGQNWTDYQKKAPVLVWFYGGGYTIGTKDSQDPSGLIKSSQVNGGQGTIFVAVNYRLGAFGWLSGRTLQKAGGVSNAGLYDQRLAIEWVAQYIHLFGGDADQITIMGGSAGGGSVEHQITAYGGKRPPPFQRAVVQSPAFLPTASQDYQDGVAQQFLSLLNVSSFQEARRLDSITLIATNALQISMAEYGTTLYGPVVDGVFVPDLASTLLATGQHARNIQLLIGHQANEAPGFTPPYIRSTADLRQYIQRTYIDINSSTLDYIVDVLYPEVYDGSYPYTNGLERAFLLIADSAFTCNTNALNKAFGNQSYAYEFQIPPALHGQDGPYTFYNGEPGIIVPIAKIQQGYITNFVATGNPNGAGLPPFPMQGANASMNAWNITGVKTERDDTANQRCVWWQQGHFA